MPDISYNQYVDAVLRCRFIQNPSFELICVTVPHLSQEAVRKALAKARKNGENAKFALPPVWYDDRVTVASYYPGDPNDGQLPNYGINEAHRVPEFHVGGEPIANIPDKPSHVWAAIRYAQDHWPEQLIRDQSVYRSRAIMLDPDNLYDKGSLRGTPRPKWNIAYSLDRTWGDIQNDPDRRTYALWEGALLDATVDWLKAIEMIAGEFNQHTYHCSRCGSGLHSDHCPGCGRQFREDYTRNDCDIPLPPSLVRLLRLNGHEFELDPARLYTG